MTDSVANDDDELVLSSCATLVPELPVHPANLTYWWSLFARLRADATSYWCGCPRDIIQAVLIPYLSLPSFALLLPRERRLDTIIITPDASLLLVDVMVINQSRRVFTLELPPPGTRALQGDEARTYPLWRHHDAYVRTTQWIWPEHGLTYQLWIERNRWIGQNNLPPVVVRIKTRRHDGIPALHRSRFGLGSTLYTILPHTPYDPVVVASPTGDLFALLIHHPDEEDPHRLCRADTRSDCASRAQPADSLRSGVDSEARPTVYPVYLWVARPDKYNEYSINLLATTYAPCVDTHVQPHTVKVITYSVRRCCPVVHIATQHQVLWLDPDTGTVVEELTYSGTCCAVAVHDTYACQRVALLMRRAKYYSILFYRWTTAPIHGVSSADADTGTRPIEPFSASLTTVPFVYQVQWAYSFVDAREQPNFASLPELTHSRRSQQPQLYFTPHGRLVCYYGHRSGILRCWG